MTDLLDQCTPQVSPVLMQALVRTESAWQPFAIGMDKAQGAVKQPASLAEAIATANELAAAGRKFSVGLAECDQPIRWSGDQAWRWSLNNESAVSGDTLFKVFKVADV